MKVLKGNKMADTTTESKEKGGLGKRGKARLSMGKENMTHMDTAKVRECIHPFM